MVVTAFMWLKIECFGYRSVVSHDFYAYLVALGWRERQACHGYAEVCGGGVILGHSCLVVVQLQACRACAVGLCFHAEVDYAQRLCAVFTVYGTRFYREF